MSGFYFDMTAHFQSRAGARGQMEECFLGHLYRDDLIKPDQMSVRPSVRPSTIFLSDLDETSYVGRGR